MKKRFLALLLAFGLLCPVRAEPAGAPVRGYVALTFDDGPSELTAELSRQLRGRGVRATFFVCSYKVLESPQTLCRLAEDGHEIGLHSCSHEYMQHMEKGAILEDMLESAQLVTECCGAAPRLFRPPGGLYNDELLEAAGELGLSVILWSVDPQDWKYQDADRVFAAVCRDVFPGAVILLHDLYGTSVQAALRLVDALQQEGYRFCTVSELAEKTGEPLQPGRIYKCFAAPD